MCAPSNLDNGVTQQSAFDAWTPDKYQTGITPDLLSGITTKNWRTAPNADMASGGFGQFVVDNNSGQIQYHPQGQGPGENYYNYDATTGKFMGTAQGSKVQSYASGILSVLGAGVGAELAFGGVGAAGTTGYATGGLAGGGGAAAAAAPAATAVAPAAAGALPPGAIDLGGGLTMMPDGSITGGMAAGASTMSNADIMSSIGAGDIGAGTSVVPPAAGGGGGGGVPGDGVTPPNPYATNTPAAITGNPTLDKMLGAIGNDPVKLAMLGLALKAGTSKPKLPGAAQTALDNANSSTTTANGTINSGGMGSPAWSVQKSAIDAQYDQLLNSEVEAIKQNSANSGMGLPQNSMVVQQQINAARERSMGARQEAYSRALSENITAAVAQLTGGNSVLTSIAQMQLSQSRDAQATAAEVAALAAQLGM